MQRIMIVGPPGSGKSTLARALGAARDLPVVHLDHIHLQAGWVDRPQEARLVLIRRAEAEPRWIIEGNLRATTAERIARADLVIWLDLPLGLRLWRVVKRLWHYRGRQRPDMADGCIERPALLPSFLLYVIRTNAPFRQRMKDEVVSVAGGKLRHLRSRAAVASFLAAQRAARG